MILYKTPHLEISHVDGKSLLHYRALPASANMSDEEFKEAFLKSCELIEEYKPKYYLSDSREQFKPITEELQYWIVENVYPRWSKAGLEKLAIVIPADLIANLSLEQTVDEIVDNVKAPTYEIQYFDNLQKAEDWLRD